MNSTQLLASVAVFRELYENQDYTSIFDIVAEFIKDAVSQDGKFVLTSNEIRTLLFKTYVFDLPEAVIRTTLGTRLKALAPRQGAYYTFDAAQLASTNPLSGELETVNEEHAGIVSRLKSFVEERIGQSLDEKRSTELLQSFHGFLLDSGSSDKFSDYISTFVIRNEADDEFKKSLNQIREGLILYQGLRFTADINELGKWRRNLTIYLSAEHLFSALGFNGTLFKEVFDDFYKLVREINTSNPPSDKKRNRIELKYFPETKNELDRFFHAAEEIRRGMRPLDNAKPAMKEILDRCANAADVMELRTKFGLDLRNLGIYLDDGDYPFETTLRYNVESQEVLDTVKAELRARNKEVDDAEIAEYFQIFTKINFLRKGDNRRRFEDVGYIVMTEDGLMTYLGRNNAVKFDEFDARFATDMNFVTTRFWFNLKKGFSNEKTTPKSFDVVTRAWIVLQTHITSSVSNNYKQLVQETKAGTLSKEEALERSYALREKPSRPEQITAENVDTSLEFLTKEEYMVEFIREKERKDALLKEVQEQNELLQNELARRDAEAEAAKQKRMEAIQGDESSNFAIKCWDAECDARFRDARVTVAVIGLNFLLALGAIFFTLSTSFRIWLLEGGILQIVLILCYAALIAAEVLGRSYLFNKERIKSGWDWLTLQVSRKKLQETRAEFLKTRKQEYILGAREA